MPSESVTAVACLSHSLNHVRRSSGLPGPQALRVRFGPRRRRRCRGGPDDYCVSSCTRRWPERCRTQAARERDCDRAGGPEPACHRASLRPVTQAWSAQAMNSMWQVYEDTELLSCKMHPLLQPTSGTLVHPTSYMNS